MSELQKGRVSVSIAIRLGFVLLAFGALPGIALSQSSGADQSGNVGSAVDAAGNLQEIVVTARRREERLQDVPIAVIAFSEATLQQKGVIDFYSLQLAAPSITPSAQLTPNSTVFNIRGQPTGAQIYLNEVPWAGLGTEPFYDMESVQVIAGAQGTLFGRTAVGGAVLFTPVKPTYNFEGDLQVTTGARNDNEYVGMINIPIVADKLAVRLAASVVRQRGYTYDETTGQYLDDRHNQAVRASILFTPVSWLENYTAADWYDNNQNGYSSKMLHLIVSNPTLTAAQNLSDALGPRLVQSTTAANQLNPCFLVNGTSCPWVHGDLGYPTGPSVLQQREWGVTNKTTITISDLFNIKYIFGYRRDANQILNQDLDGTPYFLEQYEKPGVLPVEGLGLNDSGTGPGDNDSYGVLQKTSELHFYGAAFDKTLNYLVGFFYENTFSAGEPHALTSEVYPITSNFGGLPFLALDNEFPVKSSTTETAVFGQVTYDFGSLFTPLKGLNLTVGARTTRDHTHSTATNAAVSPIFPVICDYGGPILTCSKLSSSYNSGVNSNVTVDYKFNPNLMVYAATRSAYQPGGVNTQNLPPGFTQFQTFGPEHIKDYEVGIKNEWALGSTRGIFNADIYHVVDKDLQRNEQIPGLSDNITTNAARAHVNGLELQTTIAPGGILSGWELSLYYNYTDAKYDAYPNPADPTLDFATNPIDFTPTSRGTVSLSDRISFGHPNEAVVPSVSWTVQTKYWYNPTALVNYPGNPPDPLSYIPGYGLANGRVDWVNAGGLPLQVSFFVRNMLNKLYLENGNYYADNTTGFDDGTYGEPRTWGISLKYHFSNAR
jgi:iron complex outermembrane receptor protein